MNIASILVSNANCKLMILREMKEKILAFIVFFFCSARCSVCFFSAALALHAHLPSGRSPLQLSRSDGHCYSRVLELELTWRMTSIFPCTSCRQRATGNRRARPSVSAPGQREWINGSRALGCSLFEKHENSI
jgi:hypothetical protein